jgi:hypothetical protein
MKADRDGLPVVEGSAEGLGVRLDGVTRDIPVVRGIVTPVGRHGMSVFGDPRQMHPQRRPTFLEGGKSLLPLFALDERDIPEGLGLTQPNEKTHMMVEPGRRMPIEEYVALLGATRERWTRILGL